MDVPTIEIIGRGTEDYWVKKYNNKNIYCFVDESSREKLEKLIDYKKSKLLNISFEKHIREKKEYFRRILENLLSKVILNRMWKTKKIMSVIGTDETTKKNPPFYIILILS